MKSLRPRIVSLCGALAIATMGLALPEGSDAATISLEPATPRVAPGETVEVDIAISGLEDLSAPSLGAYDLAVAFDASVLSFSDASFGDPLLGDQLDLSGFGTVSGVTPGSGSVELFEISLDAVSELDTRQASAFRLARLSFRAIAPGTSDLGLQILAAGDAAGEPLAVQASGGSVSVIPEPTAALLFAAGVLLVTRTVRGASARG